MMFNIKDLINNRAKQLTIESNRTELQLIQDEVNRFFKEGLKATKIHPNGTLTLTADNAGISSSAWLKQRQIIESIESALPGIVEKLYIKVV